MTQPDAQVTKAAWFKVLLCPDLDAVHAEIANLDPAYDGIEWRLDAMLHMPSDASVCAVMRAAPVPVMLTLRTKAHGGHADLSTQAYADAMLYLARLAPSYLDCESHVSNSVLTTICADAPHTQIVRSHHFLTGPPPCWSMALDVMRHDGVHAYKLVADGLSTAQALQQLTWLQHHADATPLIVHAMNHTFSRVLAPIMGSRMVFFIDQTGPGGLDLQSASTLYRMRSHSRDTAIYALLGAPIVQSKGHRVHNPWFDASGMDAVYVKLPVGMDDWQPCWQQLISWERFQGASITTPLKTVMCAVAQGGKAMHAVNTLVRHPNRIGWLGHQTDGVGAYDALVRWLQQPCRILLVGGGGANRAIGLYLRRCGHQVAVLQRRPTAWRCWFAAHNIDRIEDVSSPPDTFDVVIYGVPPETFIDASWQMWLATLSPKVTMDLSYGRPSPWLTWANQHWPQAVSMDGHALFMAQARAQQCLWRSAMLPDHSEVERSAEAITHNSTAHMMPTLVNKK